MSTIVERNGRFLVRVRMTGFRPVARTFTLRKDATAYARRVECEMESGRWVEAADLVPSLREAVQDYRKVIGPTLKGRDTYKYRYDEFEALPFALKLIDKVTPADLSVWRDGQSALHKPATVVRKLAMLSAIFSWGIKERGWLKVNPVTLVRKPRVSDGRSRTLSDEEVSYLLGAAFTSKAPWLAPALAVLMHSAMRRGELFGLRRCDVDTVRCIALLQETKAGGGREVPLCPRSLAALAELASAAEERGDQRLLPFDAVGSLSTRIARTIKRARKTYEEDCQALGQVPGADVLRDLRTHDLRHHSVTMWATTGALSLPELMAVSGHRTPRMLTRYTHLSASTLAGKLAGLSVTDGVAA